MPRVTEGMRVAMRRYYCHRAAQASVTWDKQADIQAIWKSCPKRGPKRVTYMECTAGTFLIWWKDGCQTIHNEDNYWRGTVFTRWRNGVTRRYADLSGKKCKPEAVRS